MSMTRSCSPVAVALRAMFSTSSCSCSALGGGAPGASASGSCTGGGFGKWAVGAAEVVGSEPAGGRKWVWL